VTGAGCSPSAGCQLYRAIGLTAGLKHLEVSFVVPTTAFLIVALYSFQYRQQLFGAKSCLGISGKIMFVIHFWSFMVMSRLVVCLERKAIKYTN